MKLASVKVEFQLTNQGRWPVNISAEKTDNCDVNDAHFIWDNEYMLGKMVSIAVRERRVLPTRTGGTHVPVVLRPSNTVFMEPLSHIDELRHGFFSTVFVR